MRVNYDPEADILYIIISEAPIKDTVESDDDVLIEIAENGNVAGIEIWNASKNLLDPIAKVLSTKIRKSLDATTRQ